MKFLIIGSDSFIAQKLILCLNGHSVRGISRTGIQSNNEIELSDFVNISEKEFEDTDIVINFAAIVHRPDIKDQDLYNEVNHKLAVLNSQKAKLAGVKLFIQMSTIAVYGNSQDVSITTIYSPLSPYAKSKLNADEDLLALQDKNFKVAIVRPPMVYGGGRAPGNMQRLIKLADKGLPLPFKGIENKRCFINIHNLIQYLAIIAEKQLHGIYIVADHEPVSTEYLLHTISKYLGRQVYLFKIPGLVLKMLRNIRPNEFDKLFGRLQVETNFPHEDLIHKHSVEQGIQEMVEFYKKRN